jgi:hypothetical protein
MNIVCRGGATRRPCAVSLKTTGLPAKPDGSPVVFVNALPERNSQGYFPNFGWAIQVFISA